MKFTKLTTMIFAVLFIVPSVIQAAEVFQPVYSEDFESTSEFGLPPGWTEENQTDPGQGSYVNGDTTDLAKSDELQGWTVLTIEKLQQLGSNRLTVPAVVQGKSVYCESDNRSGIQRDYLYTPVWDFRQKQKIQMRFDSNYTQNQDNIAFAEYTLQGNLKNDDANKKWLPIFYFVKNDEPPAAGGDVQTLMENNGLDDNAGDAYIYYIGADVTAIDFTKQIIGLIDDDQVSSKKREIWDLPQAGGQQYVQVRFFYGGGGSWYWGIDNFIIGGFVEGELPKTPDTPTLSITPEKPTVQDKVTLNASAYVSQTGVEMKKGTWEVAVDSEFQKIVYTATTTAVDQKSVEVPVSKLPVGTPLYARLQYIDKNDGASQYSTTVQFTLTMGTGLNVIFSENFESIEEGQLPTGWTCVNLSDLSGAPPLVDLTGWTVINWNTFSQLGDADKYTSVRAIVGGEKSCLANSDNYSPYEEAHLFTPKINLTGVKNVYLTFSSNYEQNQDNIGVLEYSIDGGNIDESATITGTFLPIAYLLEVPDVKLDTSGNIDAAATFDPGNMADGTSYSYGYYAFAALTMPVADLAPYISPRVNDDAVESKRFEKYRLPKADNQANVRIRWMNMGTNSWFWGIDDVQIWGDNGMDVSDWSLF